MDSVDILYRGVELTVEGDYVPYKPPRLTADPYYSTPAEGGYFESATVIHRGEDIYPLIEGTDQETKIFEIANDAMGMRHLNKM